MKNAASTGFCVGEKSERRLSQYHPRQWVGWSAFQPHPLTQVVLTSPLFPALVWLNTKSGRSRLIYVISELWQVLLRNNSNNLFFRFGWRNNPTPDWKSSELTQNRKPLMGTQWTTDLFNTRDSDSKTLSPIYTSLRQFDLAQVCIGDIGSEVSEFLRNNLFGKRVQIT